MQSPPLRFPTKVLNTILPSPISVKCAAHLSLADVITQKINPNNIWGRVKIVKFFQPLVTSSLLGLDNLLNSLTID